MCEKKCLEANNQYVDYRVLLNNANHFAFPQLGWIQWQKIAQ